MNKFFLTFFSVACFAALAQQTVQSPAEFLGYELGDRFTRHHAVVEYFKHVDAAAANVQVIQYGETYEKRPLLVAVIASPENFAQLDQIRQDNLKRIGMLPGQPSTKVGIVWLSYNVHGNEANSTEASMKTLYELVNPANSKTKEWLKNTVVIIDPCINPDGRDRFANFYNQYGNALPNADPQAREHREPWPGGRPNHYLFDLNRDWAWLTQTESQARIKLYNQWMPHVHVDYHEQGYNSPYFFAPAAEPMHEVITSWQKQLQEIIGRNNAKYFDEQGWLYFTKESFDIYYPSYGDSYPTYSGAIGMTYEQGGIGAGLIVKTREGDPMTLKDRIAHHFTTGMSTLEIASVNSGKMVDEFEKYFRENAALKVPYKTYVLKADNNRDKLKQITKWMEAHAIKFGTAAARPLKGFDYQTQTTTNFNLSADDIVINIDQPKGRFITTAFEPQSKLNDSLTYDVTAWNLIYGSGLKAYAVVEKIEGTKAYQPATSAITGSETPYTYLCRYQSISDARFLAALLQKNIAVRSAVKPFSLGGQSYDAGTLLITKRNNEDITDFNKTVKELATKFDRNVVGVTTGFADQGPDVGSGDMTYIKIPKIALLGGDQTSSQSHGQIWHFLEQTLNYPVTVLGTDYFRNIDLWQYNVLIVPDGSYRMFDEETLSMISRWVGDGGRLILLERANNAFADKKGFLLKPFDAGKKKEEEKKNDASQLVAYGDAERKELSKSLFGAIYKVTLDKTHPLAFGLGSTYYSLKTNELHYNYLNGAWNVGTLRGKVKPVLGFSGKKINDELQNSLLYGVENKGQGLVIYLADNPLFRCFWEDGKLLFANALFMGN